MDEASQPFRYAAARWRRGADGFDSGVARATVSAGLPFRFDALRLA